VCDGSEDRHTLHMQMRHDRDNCAS
jgi:hypothetical protein